MLRTTNGFFTIYYARGCYTKVSKLYIGFYSDRSELTGFVAAAFIA